MHEVGPKSETNGRRSLIYQKQKYRSATLSRKI